MKNVFQIQFHESTRKVKRLIKWLGAESNYFILCYDSDKVSATEINELKDCFGSDTVEYIPRRITWAGWSQVESTLVAISSAVNRFEDWTYFINLSDADIPLKTPVARADFLRDSDERRHSFAYSYKNYDSYRSIVCEPTGHTKRIDHFHRKDRPTFLVDESAQDMFLEIVAGDFGRNDLRVNLWVEEVENGNALSVRTLTRREADERYRFFQNYPYSFGRQWICLRRPLCEWISCANISEPIEVMSKLFIPDECFFQTIFRAKMKPKNEILLSHNLFFKNGSPEQLTDEDLSELKSSKAFFARKLTDEAASTKLLKWVDRISSAASSSLSSSKGAAMPTSISSLTDSVVDPLDIVIQKFGRDCTYGYYPNPGNLGDTLISAGTIIELERKGLKWFFFNPNKPNSREADVVVYGGGGNLVPYYSSCRNFIETVMPSGKPIVILPHSVRGHEDILTAAKNLTIFCREEASFRHVRQFSNLDVHLADDLALSIDLSWYGLWGAKAWAKKNINGSRRLLAFRDDGEKARDWVGAMPGERIDISTFADSSMSGIPTIMALTSSLLTAIGNYQEVYTDRLHIGIAGSILGLNVFLFDNSYGKCKGVYELSLLHRFPNTKMMLDAV